MEGRRTGGPVGALRALQAWVEASAFRKIFGATVALTLAIAAGMSVAGYVAARRVIQRSVLAELEAQSEVAAHEVELTVGGVMNAARALARNGIITNALVDSEGRELYVRPLLKDFAAVAPTAVHLVLVDFRGRTIACNRHDGHSAFVDAPWIPQVVGRGEIRVLVERTPEGPNILFAQPVIFPGTDRPEGALVSEIALPPIVERFAAQKPGLVFDLLDPGAPREASGEATLDADVLVAERPLALGDAGDLRLHVGVPHAIAFRSLHRFGVLTAAGVLVTLAVVLVAVWLVAMRLTRGVRELSAVVREAARGDPKGARVPVAGGDEVAALGESFNVLLSRLEEASAARLAEQVERREGAERALRLAREAVEQAVEAIDVVTDDGRIAFANGAAARMRGLTRGEAIGQRWEALFGRSPEWWRETWERLRERRTLEVSLRIQEEDGTVPVLASLVYFELDGAEHCIATTRDVRERLRVEATERLASLGTLAAGVAHEINNPLAYVLGNLAFVKESLDAPPLAAASGEERRALEEAIHGAERVRDVVRSLRAYSRAGEGPPVRVDVAAELRGALRLVESTIRHQARVVEQIEEVPPVVARSNELGQVFVNLLVNAAQAVRPAGGEILVRCHPAVDGRIAVEVADNGAGIPVEIQRRIFEPFFTTKAVGDGTGLGLSICHGIVTRIGGSIAFESEPGVGTRFTVLLPPAGPARALGEEEAIAPPRGRILLVDDDPAVSRALARMLGRTAEVTIEASAEAALDRLATGPAPDAILCDVMMPVVDGPAFHGRLKERDPGLARRVVFITGGAVSREVAAAVAATGQPCVDKPPEREALARAIAQVRGASQAA
jgi:PAS domain S-box-containing protein